MAQEINPHHPGTGIFTFRPRAGSSRAGSLALVWDPWEHPELGTSNLQHLRFFPAALACSHVSDPRRCTDAPIRQRILPSSDPRLGRSKLAVTPGTIVYPAMYNDPWFPCPVRTVVWWYLLSCTLLSTGETTKRSQNIKNNQKYKFFSFFYVRPFLVSGPFFPPNIYFVHWFFFFFLFCPSGCPLQGRIFLHCLLVPFPPRILARDSGTFSTVGQIHAPAGEPPDHLCNSTCIISSLQCWNNSLSLLSDNFSFQTKNSVLDLVTLY